MEKISGILPKSPRMITDEKAERPVRPGAPAFGRDEGSVAIRDRVSLSSVQNANGLREFENYRNPKEAKQVKIVEDLNRKFFMQPEAKVENPVIVAVVVPNSVEDQFSQE